MLALISDWPRSMQKSLPVMMTRRKRHRKVKLRGAWRDCDTNDILLTAPLFFTFLTSNFPTLFVLLTSSFNLVLLKKILQEKEKYPKNHPKHLSSWHLYSFVNHAETWYTASTYTGAKRGFKELSISLYKSRYWWKTSKNALLPYPVSFDEA